MSIGLTPEMVMTVAISKTGRKFSERQFKSMFGISLKITIIAWNLMLSSSPDMVNKSIRVEDLLIAENSLTRMIAYFTVKTFNYLTDK